MEKFTHKFTASGIAYKLPVTSNFVIAQVFKKEISIGLGELSYPELCEYAEACKQAIIKKHHKK